MKNHSFLFCSLIFISVFLFGCNNNIITDGYEKDPFKEPFPKPTPISDVPLFQGLEKAPDVSESFHEVYHSIMEDINDISSDEQNNQNSGSGRGIGAFVFDFGKKLVTDFLSKKAKDWGTNQLESLWNMIFKTEKNEVDKMKVALDKLNDIQTQLTSIINTLNIGQLDNAFANRNTNISELAALNKICWNNIKDIVNSSDSDEIKKEKIKNAILEWDNKGGTTYAFKVLDSVYLGHPLVSQQGKYLPDLYDELAYKLYPWEHEGYDFRESYRYADMSLITQTVVLACYCFSEKNNPSNYDAILDSYKKILDIYNARPVNKPRCFEKTSDGWYVFMSNEYNNFNTAGPNYAKNKYFQTQDVLVCQIKGLENRVFSSHLGFEDFSWSLGHAIGARISGKSVSAEETKRFAGSILHNVKLGGYEQFIKNYPKGLYAPLDVYQKIFNYYKDTNKNVKSVGAAISRAGFRAEGDSANSFSPSSYYSAYRENMKYLYQESEVTMYNDQKGWLFWKEDVYSLGITAIDPDSEQCSGSKYLLTSKLELDISKGIHGEIGYKQLKSYQGFTRQENNYNTYFYIIECDSGRDGLLYPKESGDHLNKYVFNNSTIL